MLGTISHRSLFEPRSLVDALHILNEESVTPMAGCTDLYVSLNFGTLTATRFVNLWRLDALRSIERRGDRLSIGALATYTDIIGSPLVRRWLPMLAAAAREIGGVQIQNRGTIGGNIANASPAGDSLPVLLAYDAIVHVASVRGERMIPFAELYTGYRRLALLRNDRGKRLSDQTVPAGLDPQNHNHWGSSAGFMDLAGQGRLDLVLLNYVVFGPRERQYCEVRAGVRMAATEPVTPNKTLAMSRLLMKGLYRVE